MRLTWLSRLHNRERKGFPSNKPILAVILYTVDLHNARKWALREFSLMCNNIKSVTLWLLLLCVILCIMALHEDWRDEAVNNAVIYWKYSMVHLKNGFYSLHTPWAAPYLTVCSTYAAPLYSQSVMDSLYVIMFFHFTLSTVAVTSLHVV